MISTSILRILLLFTALACIPQPAFSQQKEQAPYSSIKTPDGVAGNDSVPRIHYTDVSFKRTLIVRFKYQTDILEGLKELVEKEKISNAVIICGIGSVYSYHVHSVSNSSFPSKNYFVKKEEPNDVLSITGYVINGRIHAHISLSNGNTAVGGHLEPGTKVFTFCVITIGILEDTDSITRFDDKTWR